jgi:hypothetical protein
MFGSTPVRSRSQLFWLALLFVQPERNPGHRSALRFSDKQPMIRYTLPNVAGGNEDFASRHF